MIKEYFHRNLQFVLMLIVWVVSGMIHEMAALGVITLSLLLMKRKGLYAEMIIGFIFILILSDSRQYELMFAQKVKDIYLLILAAFYLLDLKTFRFKNTLFLSFVPFLVWSLAMAFRGPDLMVAIQKTLSYGLLYVVAPAYFIKSFKTVGPVFIRDFIILVLVLLVIGLLLLALNPGFVFYAGRFTGIFGNPNGLGIFVTLMVALTVSVQIKFPDLFEKNQLIFVYGLLALSAILTGSRNTLMSIFIFLIFVKFHKISYWYGFMAVIVAILLYQVVFSNLPTILEMLGLSKALRADTLESGSGRMIAWLFAFKNLYGDVKLFIFGGGFNYDEYLYHLNYKMLSALGHQGGVHNTYLALWLNTGIIGLVLWLIGFLRIIFNAVLVSYTALPLMYMVSFSIFFEAWLMASLNPFHITYILILTIITLPGDQLQISNPLINDLYADDPSKNAALNRPLRP